MGQRNGVPNALSISIDISQIEKLSETRRIPAVEPMRVPAVIYGGESLIRDMDDTVAEQLKCPCSVSHAGCS